MICRGSFFVRKFILKFEIEYKFLNLKSEIFPVAGISIDNREKSSKYF